ncbi:hypothetical protein RclHR1_00490012 [Rhizophagus clarus]|uniref:Crinkler effector protein N-terminal domain-containing protein n=1 Tax=Rhizophagus clarus TaxID=94130 RepID=A0A2Z6RJQ4_9GLOM|nr:hypothetical protein RclHR1_00490012 [Rhizophagus clarus]GES80635.1 hypothetical protein GLOIN_2v1781572 [Rhizophagus clarus]
MSVQLWFQFEKKLQELRKNGKNTLKLKDILDLAILPSSVLVESIVLKAKNAHEDEYTVLDSEYLRRSNFRKLSDDYDIAWANPIIVSIKESSEGEISEGEASGATTTEFTETLMITTPSQSQSNEIWIRHNNQTFSYNEEFLNQVGENFDVEKLIVLLKIRLGFIVGISDRIIILRKEDENLELQTPVSELYNTQDTALDLIINDLTDDSSKLTIDDFHYASAAFECEFKCNINYIGYFHEYITSCHNSSKDTYIPYISIVQSSGYGKSRLIKEHSNQVYTLYLNLGIDQQCFPRPSSCAKEFIISFQKAKDPDVWFNNLLAKAASIVVSEIKKSNTNQSSFWKKHLDDNGKFIWEPAIKAANEIKTDNELINIRDRPGYLEQNFTSGDGIKILLCIDEGRKLMEEINENLKISLFRCLRRALRNNKWRARGLFSVILDTTMITSQISNFLPALGYDPTIKTLSQEDKSLFKPFIYISTYNSLVVDSGNFYSQAFSMGRPCWKALRDEYIKDVIDSDPSVEDYAWEKVKLLVKAKLQGGTNNPIDNEGKNLTSIAILASLCSVDISPLVHFASSLIASHLGTCLSISQDRTKILVCYPSEPLVTEAAYEFLDDKILHLIAQSFCQGVVEPEKRGEIVGELILILTRQKLYKKLIKDKKATFFTGEIKLEIFLNNLLKDNPVLKEEHYEHNFFKRATVSFTRFVTIRTIPTLNDVRRGYKSCVAFNLKRNQQGADFLIPVKCDENYGIWIIQIKNHNLPKYDSSVKVDSTSKLEPSYVFSKTDLKELEVPYLAMYWQLGAQETGITEAEWEIASRTREEQPPRIHYIILSLKSFKVAYGNTLKALRTILEAYIDPYDPFWSYDKFLNDQTDFIESFLPWYPPNSKIDNGVLLDKYNDDDAQTPPQD